MLVLSRTRNEAVALYLGGVKVAEVTLVATGKDKIKLGFTGSSEVAFVRSELSAEAIREFIGRTQVENHAKKDQVK
jgi:sRNA-binding carbon storage regulator CsrA